MPIIRRVVSVDRSNGYPLTLVPTPAYCWGLFVPTDSTNQWWTSNFFFSTRKVAETHAKKTFRTYAIGKVQS